MRNRELLERFIKDNFNKKNFEIAWVDDVLVSLTDKKGDNITLLTLEQNKIITKINGEDYLTYMFGYDYYDEPVWVVHPYREFDL